MLYINGVLVGSCSHCVYLQCEIFWFTVCSFIVYVDTYFLKRWFYIYIYIYLLMLLTVLLLCACCLRYCYNIYIYIHIYINTHTHTLLSSA
jgi:hypothetical protein